MNLPLSFTMEKTKIKLLQAFNQIIDESKLPAYLVEGMLLDFLAEIRDRKNAEITSDFNTYLAYQQEEAAKNDDADNAEAKAD